MKDDSHTAPGELLNELGAEASRIEEDSLYSAKGHFEAEAYETKTHYRLGIPATATAALSGISAVMSHPTIAVALAIVSAVASALMTFMDPRAQAVQHQNAGVRYLALRNRARIYRRVELQHDDSKTTLIQSLKQLADERDAVNTSSPPIPRRAFDAARKGIEAGEAKYEVDAE